MTADDYLFLSNTDLAKELKEYADERKGEIADLCMAASIRINILSAHIKGLREDMEDDLR